MLFRSAHDMSPEMGAVTSNERPSVVFGLNARQIGLAAGTGAWIGGGAGLATRSLTSGAGLGVIGAIFVAHLAAEEVVAGGVYYFWPENRVDEPAAIPTESGRRIPGLGFSAETRR